MYEIAKKKNLLAIVIEKGHIFFIKRGKILHCYFYVGIYFYGKEFK